MSFVIKYLQPHLLVGVSDTMPEIKDQADFSKVSAFKNHVLDEVRKEKALFSKLTIDQHYYAVNKGTTDRQYYYLVGVQVDCNSPSQESFQLPEGQYAVFNGEVADRLSADKLINQAYQEIAQSSKYQINGTFNLEVVDVFMGQPTSDFAILIPVIAKNK